MKKLVCKDIRTELFKIRYKRGRSHCIKYYPWVILFFICLPIFAFAQTKADVLKELHRQKVPHANIVLAQARLESGNFKSDFYRQTNNLFGLKKGKKYATYKTWRDSIKDYKERISARYQGGCYYAFLENIKYATNPNYIKLLQEVVRLGNESVTFKR